jgi:hypothetical protein
MDLLSMNDPKLNLEGLGRGRTRRHKVGRFHVEHTG